MSPTLDRENTLEICTCTYNNKEKMNLGGERGPSVMLDAVLMTFSKNKIIKR